MRVGSSCARGFTLIEVMIALVIAAILAAVALPAYRDQLRRSTRAQAQAFLTDMASRQQQYLVEKRAYAASVAALGMAAPASVASAFGIEVAAAADGFVFRGGDGRGQFGGGVHACSFFAIQRSTICASTFSGTVPSDSTRS